MLLNLVQKLAVYFNRCILIRPQYNTIFFTLQTFIELFLK